jgi:hypothetical protein
MTFNIPLLVNITNLFGNWLNGVANKDKGLEEVYALLWAIWTVCNEFIFNRRNFPPFLQLFLWLRTGSICDPISSRQMLARV